MTTELPILAQTERNRIKRIDLPGQLYRHERN